MCVSVTKVGQGHQKLFWCNHGAIIRLEAARHRCRAYKREALAAGEFPVSCQAYAPKSSGHRQRQDRSLLSSSKMRACSP